MRSSFQSVCPGQGGSTGARLYWCANHSEPQRMPDKSPKEITAVVLVPDSWFRFCPRSLVPPHAQPLTWPSRSRSTLRAQHHDCLRRRREPQEVVACHQSGSARRPSRLGATCVVTVRPHVQETHRCSLTPPDNTTRLPDHPRCLIWRLCVERAISFVADAHCGRSCERDASLIAADL